MTNYRLVIFESERGWGQKHDFIDGYDSLEKAKFAFDEINSKNKSQFPAPDWYMIAESIEKQDDETGRWFKVYP